MRLLLLCLTLLPLAASADDAPVRERWTFTRDWSLVNQPLKNAFTTVSKGEMSIHDGRIFEQHSSETRLTKAKLNGLPLPIPFLPPKMRLFKGTADFERLDSGTFDATNARALTQLFVDYRLIDTLARRCQLHWRAIEKVAKGTAAETLVWNASFPVMHFARKEGEVRITLTGTGAKIGTGQRALKQFLFVGTLADDRLSALRYEGTIENLERKIVTTVKVAMTCAKRESVEAEGYGAALDSIARIDALARAEKLTEALAVALTPPAPLAEGFAVYKGKLQARKGSVAWVRATHAPAFERARKLGKPLAIVFEQDG